MSIIIIDLSSARNRFEIIIKNLLEQKNLIYSTIDGMKIDHAYTDTIKSLTGIIFNRLKNQSDIPEEGSVVLDNVVDSLTYFLFSEFGIDVEYGKLTELVVSIETALMSDILSELPIIDNAETKILNFNFIPLNNLSIEYKINNSDSVPYQQFTTESGITFSEPVDLMINYKYKIPLKLNDSNI